MRQNIVFTNAGLSTLSGALQHRPFPYRSTKFDDYMLSSTTLCGPASWMDQHIPLWIRVRPLVDPWTAVVPVAERGRRGLAQTRCHPRPASRRGRQARRLRACLDPALELPARQGAGRDRRRDHGRVVVRPHPRSRLSNQGGTAAEFLCAEGSAPGIASGVLFMALYMVVKGRGGREGVGGKGRLPDEKSSLSEWKASSSSSRGHAGGICEGGLPPSPPPPPSFCRARPLPSCSFAPLEFSTEHNESAWNYRVVVFWSAASQRGIGLRRL